MSFARRLNVRVKEVTTMRTYCTPRFALFSVPSTLAAVSGQVSKATDPKFRNNLVPRRT